VLFGFDMWIAPLRSKNDITVVLQKPISQAVFDIPCVFRNYQICNEHDDTRSMPRSPMLNSLESR
jgi:hypothetical protein